jgi:ABC-type bacteriocin/lantibiotic exporter with double-glycine peptidase domain
METPTRDDSGPTEPLLSPGFTCRADGPIALQLDDGSTPGSTPWSTLRRRLSIGASYEEEDHVQKPPSFARLLALALPDYQWLCLGLLSLVVRLPFSLASPHFMSRAIGSCIDGDADRLRVSLYLFAGAGGINAALDFWNIFLFTFVQNRIIRRLRSKLFVTILHQEVGFFDANSSGSISSRLTSDCTEIASDLSW